MCEIILNEVSFSYNTDTNIVLNKVSLTIKKGEFIVVVGPNGAGKSTLIKAIAGLITPQSGRILLDGQSVDKAKTRGLISYVPQNYEKGGAGFPATVEEIVSLGLISAVRKVKSKKAANHIVSHMLKLVDAENLKNRRIGDLSGGQMQRVMVARALAGNPELLLLDEPTSGIDFNASAQIYETLGELNRNLGITIVMVSHDIDNATRWAGKVACINRAVCFYGDGEEFRSSHNDTRHLFFRKTLP